MTVPEAGEYGWCNLCKLFTEPGEIAQHMADLHPEYWENVEKWPDGEPVVVDLTLEPNDFA